MKIERIGNHRLQIHVTSDDLLEREMDIKDLWQNGPRAQQLFWEIVTLAYDKFGFVVEDGMVLVEAIGLIPDGVIVILTKDRKKEDSPAPAEVKGPREITKAKPRKSLPRDLAFRFADLEDLLQSLPHLTEFRDLHTSVYHYRQSFFLTFHLVGPERKHARRIQAILSEFASRSPYSIHVLKEYGKPVAEGTALQILKEHFLTE